MVALLLGVNGTVWAAALPKQEQSCAKALGKNGGKLAKASYKAIASCRLDDLSGKAVGACPNAATDESIAKAEASVHKGLTKGCSSVCSISNDIACIDEDTCPPIVQGQVKGHEACSGVGGSNLMSIKHLGYPGPYCVGIVGGKLKDADDVATCVTELTGRTNEALVDVVFGSLNNASAPSAGAQSCLAAISKSVQKLSDTIYKGSAGCRSSIYAGKLIASPATCRFSDPVTAEKVTAAEQKLEDTILASCNATQILELDLCNAGVGGTADPADAADCLIAAVNEITDTDTLPTDRIYGAPISLVNGAFPPARAVCGDDVVNQSPSNFLVLGEECDGIDDSACPGLCLPPGDLYECTCANRALVRFLANGLTADLDSGFTGTSHDQGVADRAGYVNTMTGCDCSAFTDASCTGTSSDPVCTLNGFQLPNCSWDPLSAIRCDARGNNNGSDTDLDCNRCDEFTTTPNTWCQNEGDCTGQCYDANEQPQGTCQKQADCAAGLRCRGQCETAQSAGHKCVILTNGAPLPISSGGTAVCILTKFRENVVGTRNIVTGEHAVNIQQFSVVHLGVTNAVPCPVCGGFCADGSQKGEICDGRCSTTTSQTCRFDTDCPVSETCTSASPDCPGSTCTLDLVCGGGTTATSSSASFGLPCRLEAYTKQFGTTSSDCLPIAAKNISGAGLQINFLPSTSEAVSRPPTQACDNGTGFELFGCPCPSGFSAQKRLVQPNLCAGACNVTTVGCGDGAGNIQGEYTRCNGGVNVGQACDQDSDCGVGFTCSANPTHCTGGDPADERKLCVTNGDCGGGGSCVDACPGGRCLPLCVAGEDGDPEEGSCAAGPSSYHCSGVNDTFRACTPGLANGTCNAVCATTCTAGSPSGGSATPCDGTGSCPVGESCCGTCEKAETCGAGDDGKLGTTDDVPGAGICVSDVRHCFVNDLAAEGGDTLNGNGDATNVRSVTTFCIEPTSNGAVNQTAGLGGPGRLRQRGVNVTNGVLP
jgi:hypothetical protein